jgi:spore coat polysaccharide biosynthesis predicted glycosyltransferase SpsG
MGHFSRCIGLADIVSDFLEPVFIMQQYATGCQRLCADKKYEFVSLSSYDKPGDEMEVVDQIVSDGSIVVIDGYHLTGGWMPLYLKKKECKVVCIDDIHAHHFYADVIINHGGARLKDYSVEPYTKVFLGLDYAMVKKEFIEATRQRSKRSVVRNLVIAMGGTDPHGYALQLAEWFSSMEEFDQINFLSTSANKQLVNLAVLPASTLCIEACAVGIGVICGITADNQLDMYAGLTSIPAVIGIDKLMNNSDQKLKSLLRSVNVSDVNKMIDHQIKLIDGLSHQRIQTIFKELC